MLVFSKLTKIINKKGAAYIVLIDPDKKNSGSIIEKVEKNFKFKSLLNLCFG